MGTTDMLDAIVIGGGIAGLAAAWDLRDRNVLVLEATNRVGGRIKSEPRGDVWLNFGAHVFSGAGSVSDRLLAETGMSAPLVPGRLAAVSLNGKLVASGGVETFPFRLPMPLRSRVALVRAGVALRIAVAQYAKIAAPVPGEDPAVRQLRMLAFMDDRSFSQFAGRLPEDVDLLLRSTLTRSSGEPEQLPAGYGVGYFHLVWNRTAGLSRNILGGPTRFIEALALGLGDRIHRGAVVSSVRQDDDGVTVSWIEDGVAHEARAAAAVVATPAYVTRQIVAGLPDDTAAALDAIPYGPYIVGSLLTGETGPKPWDGLYALATPKRSFSMLFNMGNVLRAGETARRPGGSLMAYAAAGFARALWALDDTAIEARFREDFAALFPGTDTEVREVVVQRWEQGVPHPTVGRSKLQAPLTRPLGRVHLAGDYLGSWYTETAAQTATTAAARIRELIGG